MARRRKPSADERALWRAVMTDVTPLRPPDGEPADSVPTPPEAGAAEANGTAARQSSDEVKPAKFKAALKNGTASPDRTGVGQTPQLSIGETPGVDRRTSDRVRRGRTTIDGRLDLHGMGRDQAHEALISFIQSGHRQGWRNVLVITGKGRFARRSDDGNPRGVLRAAVPRWLNEAPIRQHVMGFHPAQPQHGGDGALYVMLRRRRDRA